MSSFTGPTGEQGNAGPTGPQGVAGPQGEQGMQGPRGYKGAEGPTGQPGVNAVAFNTTAPLGLSAVPVLAGSVTLVVGTGLPYTLGNSVVIASTALPLVYSLEGRVDAYDSANGSMTVDHIANVVGDWSAVYTSSVTVNLDGVDGPTGQTGCTGMPGSVGPTGPTGPSILDLNDVFTGVVQFAQDISVNGVNVGRGQPNDLKSTILGHNAYYSGTTGGIDWSYVDSWPSGPYTQNVAVGYQSMYCNTTGDSNVAVGVNSMLLNTTGFRNVGIGREAMLYNTTGNYNVALGSQALWANTTADSNTAVGFDALYLNTLGNGNSGIGFNALRHNTTGGRNAAVGYSTMWQNTTGYQNTAVGGDSALAYNTTGYENVALGSYALSGNQTGSRNTSVGAYSFQSVGTTSAGNDNTGLGWYAGKKVTNASGNTLIGSAAGQNVSSGNNNVTLGASCAQGLTTGSSNTLLGTNTNCPGASTQSTALGYGAQITQNNQIVLGTPTEYTYIPGSTESTSTSTGALVVAGGAGIGGRLNVGGAVAGATGTFTYLNATLGVNATLPTTSDPTYSTVVRNPTTSQLYYHATKTFVIDHPTDENKYLVHACLEGPEAGVYYRGTAEITNSKFVSISLPAYVEHIASEFTVHLTPIAKDETDDSVVSLKATEVKDNLFKVIGPNGRFHWMVHGKRLDVVSEPNKADSTLCGEGPYKWLA